MSVGEVVVASRPYAPVRGSPVLVQVRPCRFRLTVFRLVVCVFRYGIAANISQRGLLRIFRFRRRTRSARVVLSQHVCRDAVHVVRFPWVVDL